MRLPTSITPQFLAASIFLLSAPQHASALSIFARSECLRSRSQGFAALAECGDKGSLNYCIGKVPSLFEAPRLETCFVNAGCSPEEAEDEATRALDICADVVLAESDLRKRLDEAAAAGPLDERADKTATAAPAPTTGHSDPTDTAKTDKDAPETTAKPENTAPATSAAAEETSAEPQTTAPAASTPEASTPEASTPEPSTPATTNAASSETSAPVVIVTETAPPASTFTGSLTSQLVCITTTDVTVTVCPTQSTGTASGQVLSCYPTGVPVQTCAAGLLCQTDDSGNVSCMVKDDSVPLAGIIIGAVFGASLIGGVTAMVVAACRERSARRHHWAQAEAAAIARDAKRAREGKRPSVGVRSVSAQSVPGAGASRPPAAGVFPGPGYPGGAPVGYAGAGAPAPDAVPLMYGAAPMGTAPMPPMGHDPFADQYRVR